MGNEIGGSICGSFILFGGLSVLLYKPWRRSIDRRRESYHQPQQPLDEDEDGASVHTSRSLNDSQSSRVRQEADDHHSPESLSKVPRDTATPL